MVVNSQRYQKNQNFSGVRAVRRHKLGVWLVLSIGLTACAGAENPAVSASQTHVLNPNGADQGQNVSTLLLASAAPVSAGLPAPTPVVVPEAARQAVVDARVAMQKNNGQH